MNRSDAEIARDEAAPVGWKALTGLFVFTLLVHALWFALSGFPDQFVDSDGYIRVLRVEMLWQGGDWFANRLPRNNAPFGDISHFTRPLDALISALALPLVPILGVKAAIFWAGALSGPMLHAGTVAVFAWAALPLVGRTAAILAGIFVAAQGMIASYAVAMRADHHILFLFLVAAGFGCMARALDHTRAEIGYALAAGREGAENIKPGGDPGARSMNLAASAAGALAAAGIWVGVEGLAYAGLCAVAFGLAWLAGGGASKGFAFAAAFAAGLIGALLLERGTDALTIEHERLSIVHATLGVLVLAGFALLRAGERFRPDWRARTVLGGAVGAMVLAAWYGLFPSLGRGPMADFDPEVVRLIFATTSEYAPGWRLDRLPLTLGGTMLAAAWLVWRFARERTIRTNPAWLHLAACVAFYGAITAAWGRWGIYAALFSSVALAEMALRATERIQASGHSRLAREAGCALVMAAFLIGPLGLVFATTKMFAPRERTAHLQSLKTCAAKPLAAALNRPPWSDRPRVIATGANIGGEIMYRTPHGVVASLYLKGYEGLRDLNRFFAATDETAARAVLEKRRIDLIAVCPAFGIEWMSAKDLGPGTLYDRLIAGRPPAWIREAALPEDAKAYRLFEVLPEARGR